MKRDIAEKLNIGFASVNAFIAGLSYVRPHTYAATSAVIYTIIFELSHILPTAPTSHCLQFSRNISKELTVSCYGKMVQRTA